MASSSGDARAMSDISARELFKEVLCASLLDRLKRGEYLHRTKKKSHEVYYDYDHNTSYASVWSDTIYSFCDVAGLELFQLTFFKQPRTGENIVSIIAIDTGLYHYKKGRYFKLASDYIPIFKPCYSGQYQSSNFPTATILKFPPGMAERKENARGEEFASFIDFNAWGDWYGKKPRPITTVKTDLDVSPPVDKDTVRAFLVEFRDVHFDKILAPTAPLDALLKSRGRTKTFVCFYGSDNGAEATVPMAAVQQCFAKDPEALPQLLNFDDDLGEYGGVLSVNPSPDAEGMQVLCGLHADTPKADLFRALEHDDETPIFISLAEEPDVHNEAWFSWLDTLDVKPRLPPPPPPPPPRAAFCDG